MEGIRRSVRRVSVRDNLLGVMPLIRDHFEGVSPDFFQTVERRYYPVGRGLMVPFDPPMIYGVGGQLYFPWFQFLATESACKAAYVAFRDPGP